MEHLKMKSKSAKEINIELLEELFPEVIVESKASDGTVKKVLDVEKLKDRIGEETESDFEHFEFNWPGKQKAKCDAFESITKTLYPDMGEKSSVNFANTNNVYIRGDNFEALKLLQESYLEKVKMIYIDPPYNTGSDLVYKDDFALSEEEYNALRGSNNADGERLVPNSRSGGRFHSAWCSMIYSRLLLARNLLKKDGAIFISIDDNELTHLLCICDEIFGDGNHVATIPWRKRTAKSDVPFGISQDYEWIVVYAKSDEFKASIKGAERKYYETPDLPGRPWRVHDLTKQTTAKERPKSYFTIVNPKTGEEYPANPNRTWCITYDTIDKYNNEKRIVYPGDYGFLKIQKPVLRYFKDEDMQKAGENFGNIAVSTKLPDDVGMSQDGTKEITELLGSKVFSYPKPSELIKFLVKISTNPSKGDIILDFFSGSGTTAQAVMDLNLSDGGNRKFILVQYPEPCDPESGYSNICELGIDRIRRCGNRILSQENGAKVDTGFRVFDIIDSVMKDVYYQPMKLRQADLMGMVENIKPEYIDDPGSLLYSIILDWGFELSLPIEKVKLESGVEVFDVDSGALIACFASGIDEATVTEIAKREPSFALFRDGSFETCSSKINLGEIFKAISPDSKLKVI